MFDLSDCKQEVLVTLPDVSTVDEAIAALSAKTGFSHQSAAVMLLGAERASDLRVEAGNASTAAA